MEHSQWVTGQTTSFPGANPTILQFIYNFRTHITNVQDDLEQLFTAGYCYYFAKMLDDAFDGQLVWVAPFGHVAFQASDGIVYDIRGVHHTECRDYIPIEFLGDHIDDFRHIPNHLKSETTDRRLQQIMEIYSVYKTNKLTSVETINKISDTFNQQVTCSLSDKAFDGGWDFVSGSFRIREPSHPYDISTPLITAVIRGELSVNECTTIINNGKTE